MLTAKLTEEEILVRAKKMAALVKQKEDVAKEKKEAAAAYNKTIDGLEHRIARLAWSVRTGELTEEDRQRELGFDEEQIGEHLPEGVV